MTTLSQAPSRDGVHFFEYSYVDYYMFTLHTYVDMFLPIFQRALY